MSLAKSNRIDPSRASFWSEKSHVNAFATEFVIEANRFTRKTWRILLVHDAIGSRQLQFESISCGTIWSNVNVSHVHRIFEAFTSARLFFPLVLLKTHENCSNFSFSASWARYFNGNYIAANCHRFAVSLTNILRNN